jgi:hypothetical protein
VIKWSTTKKRHVPEHRFPLCRLDTCPHPHVQLGLCIALSKVSWCHVLELFHRQTCVPLLREDICHGKCFHRAATSFQSESLSALKKKSQAKITTVSPVSLSHSIWQRKWQWQWQWQPFWTLKGGNTTTFSCLLEPFKEHPKAARQQPTRKLRSNNEGGVGLHLTTRQQHDDCTAD